MATKLPLYLSKEEIAALIDAAENRLSILREVEGRLWSHSEWYPAGSVRHQVRRLEGIAIKLHDLEKR